MFSKKISCSFLREDNLVVVQYGASATDGS